MPLAQRTPISLLMIGIKARCPVSEFLEVLSHHLAHPGFQSRTLGIDCGMVFRAAVPAEWIVDVETLPE